MTFLKKCFLKTPGLIVPAAFVAFVSVGTTASAATVNLDGNLECNKGPTVGGVSVDDVTGNSGDPTNCWGAFDENSAPLSNDPGPSGDGFSYDGMQYDFVSKYDGDESKTTGADIGLTYDYTPTDSDYEGSWSFIDGALAALGYGDYLFVLKQSSKPGYAVWSFFGDSNDSYEGDWQVDWDNGTTLSHISIYAKESPDNQCTPPDPNCTPPIPLPAAGWMMISALGALVAIRRRYGIH